MNTKLRVALVLPLAGLLVTWVSFLIANFVDLDLDYSTPGIQLSVYLYLGGIAAVALLSSFAFRMSDAMHAAGSGTGLARAVYRFNGLAVVLSMVGGAIFAIGTFFSSFGSVGRAGSNQLIEVYLPIILVTAVVVYVLLQATVFRKSSAEPGAPADPRRNALGLAWSLPIIGTALALIIGLIAYGDRREIETWTWVVIQGVILASIILGTHFAVKARSITRVAPRERVVGAGALNLNFVLSVIFGAVVSIMGFSYGMDAISRLGSWNYNEAQPVFVYTGVTLEWALRYMLPAALLMLVAEVGIYLTITLRNRNQA